MIGCLAFFFLVLKLGGTSEKNHPVSSKTPKLHEEVNAILGNPKIFFARGMAINIYRTLCVLVSSSLDPPISFMSHHRGAAVYLLPHTQ